MFEILIGKTGSLTMFHLLMSQYLKPGKTQTSMCVKLKLVCVAVGAEKQDKNTNWGRKEI